MDAERLTELARLAAEAPAGKWYTVERLLAGTPIIEPDAAYIAALDPIVGAALVRVAMGAEAARDNLARYLWDGDTEAGGDEEFALSAHETLRHVLEALDAVLAARP